MAAAPNLPMPEAAVTRTISIDDTFTPRPQGLIVNPGDTVNFQNNSGDDITIQFFANNPAANDPVPQVYPPMSLFVPNGNPNGPVGFQAPNCDAAANYGIYVGVDEESGPWAIQVGVGPMYVVLTGSVLYNFPTVAVPLGNTAAGMGKLDIGPNLPSSSLGISFPTNPFNPPITTNDGPHSVKAGTSTGDYGYTVVVPNENPGGGNVIIRST